MNNITINVKLLKYKAGFEINCSKNLSISDFKKMCCKFSIALIEDCLVIYKGMIIINNKTIKDLNYNGSFVYIFVKTLKNKIPEYPKIENIKTDKNSTRPEVENIKKDIERKLGISLNNNDTVKFIETIGQEYYNQIYGINNNSNSFNTKPPLNQSFNKGLNNREEELYNDPIELLAKNFMKQHLGL